MKNLKFTIITFYQFKKNHNLENLQNLLEVESVPNHLEKFEL